MSVAALIEEAERRDIHLWAEDDRLRFDAPSGALTDDLRAALKAHKVAVIEALKADALAREAGLLVLVPGSVYLCSPSPWHEVTVEHVAGRWIAWAGRYGSGGFNGGGRGKLVRSWRLYAGPSVEAALKAAVSFAEKVVRR